MGRLEFDQKDDLTDWVDFRTDPQRHYVIHTREEDEIILQPKKSTSPVEYGYYDGPDTKDVIRALKDKGFTVIDMKRYAWKADSPVGSRMEE